MERKRIPIKYVNKGFANFYGDYIELNKRLKNNKKLKKYILEHERGHKKEFDLMHEFKINFKIMPSLFLFVLKTPSTWIDFLPIQYKNKKFIYDLNLIILYSFIIFLVFLLIKILNLG